jgi:hypothetical protein
VETAFQNKMSPGRIIPAGLFIVQSDVMDASAVASAMSVVVRPADEQNDLDFGRVKGT